jgi:hypothetical protein
MVRYMSEGGETVLYSTVRFYRDIGTGTLAMLYGVEPIFLVTRNIVVPIVGRKRDSAASRQLNIGPEDGGQIKSLGTELLGPTYQGTK